MGPSEFFSKHLRIAGDFSDLTSKRFGSGWAGVLPGRFSGSGEDMRCEQDLSTVCKWQPVSTRRDRLERYV